MNRKRIVALCLLFCMVSFSIAQAAEYKIGEKNWKIAVAQRNLTAVGYKTDRSDGILTEKTVATLKDFQQHMKLPATGKLDDKTYQTLAEAAYRKQGVPGVKGGSVVTTAAGMKGIPYRFGGVTPKGFDCSGYVQYVFARNRVTLPRTADIQFKQGLFVLRQSLRAGDLVFFSTTEPGPSHVGIYAGNGSFWHASSSRGVMLSSLSDVYWQPRYVGARRILLE